MAFSYFNDSFSLASGSGAANPIPLDVRSAQMQLTHATHSLTSISLFVAQLYYSHFKYAGLCFNGDAVLCVAKMLVAWYQYDILKPHTHASSSVTQVSFGALQDSNIAWSSDRNSLYGHYNSTNFNEFPQYRGGGGISGYVNDDQHFLVWMRPGAARTVRKLYAQINSDIPAGCSHHHDLRVIDGIGSLTYLRLLVLLPAFVIHSILPF